MDDQLPLWLIEVPIVEPLDIRRMNVFEHSPADYFRRGEYPRYLSAVGQWQPRSSARAVRAASHEEAMRMVFTP
jgi:hypothetical protein